MGQLDALWVYQQYDKKIDEREFAFRHSENLQNCLKLQKYLKTMQDNLLALDSKAQKEQERFERVEKDLAEVTEALEEGRNVLKSGKELMLGDIAEMKKDYAQMRARMKKGRETVQRSIEQTQMILSQLKEIRAGMKKAKDEYDQLRAVVEKEQAACNEDIQKIREEQKANTKGISKELLKKYNNIRITHPDAIALVADDRCGGCNMTLAALVIQRVKDQTDAIECEHCGRILYVKSE
jgi:predicted  nucleic acid-binding Zn-ribbon protein